MATTQTGTSIWAIDPKHSTIEVSAKHMMFTTVRGQFKGVSGTLTLDEANITRSSVDVEIDAASISTLEEQRDTHLRSPDFLDVDSHPKITFKSTNVRSVAANELKVTGDLTIRGTTHPVVLDTTFHGQGTTPYGTRVVAFSAETTVKRSAFGLTWNVALESGGVLVSDALKVSLEIQAVKQG